MINDCLVKGMGRVKVIEQMQEMLVRVGGVLGVLMLGERHTG